MKKIALTLVAVMLSALLLPFSAFAADQLTIPGANTAPAVDGILEEDTYMFLHDFYSTDTFSDAGDTDRTVSGKAYACWDDDNLYIYLLVNTEIHDAEASNALDMGVACAAYVACLGTADGSVNDDMRYEVGCSVDSETGEQMWKTCSPADVKDSSAQCAVWDECPFKSFAVHNSTANTTAYEFAIPWSYQDRTGKLTYSEGSQIIFNYSVNCHTADGYSSGERDYIEYGGGIWANSYTDGATVTLGTFPKVVVPEPEPEPVVEAAPEIEVPTVTEAAPITTTAAQTSDASLISVMLVLAVSAAAISFSKKK